VRRDVRRHPDRDPLRAVAEEVGELARKDDRLLEGLVVVRDEVHGPLPEVLEHRG